MKSSQLTIRYSSIAQRETTAYYIPTDDVRSWLDEVIDWPLKQVTIRILPIPHSPKERKAGGALIFAPSTRLPTTIESGIPYGQICGRLFLPVEATFQPAVSDLELSKLLIANYWYVWNPSAGLVAFEESDVLRVSDLLSIAKPADERWDHALPGTVLAHRLLTVSPDADYFTQNLIDLGKDDIGANEDRLSELPESPAESEQDQSAGLMDKGKQFLARLVKSLTELAPRTSNEPTWIDNVESWANEQLSKAQLAAARNQSLTRLLSMLDSDPDEGLRYAFPLDGELNHRGRAEPSSDLGRRDVDYDESSISGGGGPADFWEVSVDYQQELDLRYRELANREVYLGRHRRAAYIFAHLLKDYESAASALQNGHHWHEAAHLYASKLERPLEAARCIERGGLYIEAIELYEKAGQYEQVGDLYTRLEDAEKSRHFYMLAVNEYRSKADHLNAAKLLETKLDAVEDAINEYADGWHHSAQACESLTGIFRLSAQAARHDVANEWLERLRKSSPKHPTRIAKILADQATTYPDRTVRSMAEDCTRVVVARELPGARGTEVQTLLNSIGQLATGDKLLQRDCGRFAQSRTAKQTEPNIPLRTRKLKVLEVIQLRPAQVVMAATYNDTNAFVASENDSKLTVTRIHWDDFTFDQVTWHQSIHESGVILASKPDDGNRVIVHLPHKSPLPVLRFPTSDSSKRSTKAGSIAGLSKHTVAVSRTTGVLWVVEWEDRPVLKCLGPNGTIRMTKPLFLARTSNRANDMSSPIHLHARGNRIFVAFENRLVLYDLNGGGMRQFEYDHPIESISASDDGTRDRLAIAFRSGGLLSWFDKDTEKRETFGTSLENPVVTITRGGYLVAAGEFRIEVYSTAQGKLEFKFNNRQHSSVPVAILPAPQPNRFAIVTKTGDFTIYEIQS